MSRSRTSVTEFPLPPLLTRRQALWAMAGVAVLPTLTAVGCGGGGNDGEGPAALVKMRTATELPAGFPIASADLVAETAFGSGALDADGTFGASVMKDAGPTFTWLRHKTQDRFVLFGFAGAGQRGVSVKGTAVAMIATAIGVGGLRPEDGRAVVALLEADPAITTLAGVIAGRMAANPYAISEGDAQIQAAVVTCAGSLRPEAKTLAQISGARRQLSAQSSRDGGRAEPDPILVITPGVQSGSNVVQKDEPASIYYVNTFRRPAVFRTYKTGYATDAGDTMLDRAVAVGKATELPPVRGILSAILSLNQNPAFEPIESPRVGLDLGSSEKKAYYQTVCLMASGKSGGDGEPAFFSLPRYAGEVEGWRAIRTELNQHAWIGGVLYDLFATIVGGAATWLSASAAAAVIAQVQAAGSSAAQAVIDAGAGNLVRGTETCVKAAAEAGDLGVKVQAAIGSLIVRAQVAGAITATQALLNAVRALAVMIAEAIVVAGAVTALADLGFTYNDLLFSEKGVVWDETLAKSTVALSADRTTIGAGENTNLNVSIVGGKESDYRFKWKVRGGNGVLGETGKPNSGQDIETTATTVNLLSAPGDQQGTTYVVTVEAIAKSNGASLGIASKSIKIQGQTNTVAGTRTTFKKYVEDPNNPGMYNFEALVAIQFTPTPGSQYFILRGQGTPTDHFPTGTTGDDFDSPDTVTPQTHTLLRNTLIADAFTGYLGLNQWNSAFAFQDNNLLDWTWSVECYPERPA